MYSLLDYVLMSSIQRVTGQKPLDKKPPGQNPPTISKPPRVIEEIIAKYAADAILGSTNPKKIPARRVRTYNQRGANAPSRVFDLL